MRGRRSLRYFRALEIKFWNRWRRRDDIAHHDGEVRDGNGGAGFFNGGGEIFPDFGEDLLNVDGLRGGFGAFGGL